MEVFLRTFGCPSWFVRYWNGFSNWIHCKFEVKNMIIQIYFHEQESFCHNQSAYFSR